MRRSNRRAQGSQLCFLVERKRQAFANCGQFHLSAGGNEPLSDGDSYDDDYYDDRRRVAKINLMRA